MEETLHHFCIRHPTRASIQSPLQPPSFNIGKAGCRTARRGQQKFDIGLEVFVPREYNIKARGLQGGSWWHITPCVLEVVQGFFHQPSKRLLFFLFHCNFGWWVLVTNFTNKRQASPIPTLLLLKRLQLSIWTLAGLTICFHIYLVKHIYM